MEDMSQRAEQLVLEYLSTAGQALYGRMPARRRTVYLLELRERIDTARAASGSDSEASVRRILRELGDPAELVERDCAAEGTEPPSAETGTGGPGAANGTIDPEDEDSLPPRPAHADRPPPPWRGGPSRGVLALLTTSSPAPDPAAPGARRGTAAPGTARTLALAVREHPGEMCAVALFAVAGLWWSAAFLWVLGAVLIVLSQVVGARDKWIAVGVPVLAAAIGMALWPGEAKFVDVYISRSFAATGVVGLGLASLGCALFLLVRLVRVTRAALT